ncbi:hypothetical protein OG21DRAFT_355774 [Imleria badia]|nr:hypothetical protein OG21DRAFT_355774 [Imleria badia]
MTSSRANYEYFQGLVSIFKLCFICSAPQYKRKFEVKTQGFVATKPHGSIGVVTIHPFLVLPRDARRGRFICNDTITDRTSIRYIGITSRTPHNAHLLGSTDLTQSGHGDIRPCVGAFASRLCLCTLRVRRDIGRKIGKRIGRVMYPSNMVWNIRPKIQLPLATKNTQHVYILVSKCLLLQVRPIPFGILTRPR